MTRAACECGRPLLKGWKAPLCGRCANRQAVADMLYTAAALEYTESQDSVSLGKEATPIT